MLYSLTLHNFKSYPGTVVIGPFKQFSCVIGPNGAGKSNLMDAISFVLGVRAQYMRSQALKDLINVQSDGTCWVELELKSPDLNPEIYRRIVNRQGDSSYKYNQQSVTFKQYQENLENRGLMIKTRNFLVFQGDVESIASQSPLELTKLIEQISGSIDYKREYEELQEKLESINQSSVLTFNKRKNINAEYKQFQHQKAEVEQYSSLLKQHEEAVLSLFLWKLYHLDRRLRKLNQNAVSLRRDITVISNQYTEKETSFRQSKQVHAAAKREKLKAEQRLSELERNKEKLLQQGHIDLTEKVEYYTNRLKKTMLLLNRRSEDFKIKEQNLSGLKEELNKLIIADQRFEAQEQNDRRYQFDAKHMLEYSQLKENVIRRAAQDYNDLENLKRLRRAEEDNLQALDITQAELINGRSECEAKLKELNDELISVEQALSDKQLEFQNVEFGRNEAETNRARLSQNEKEASEALDVTLQRLLQARADLHDTEHKKKMREMVKTLKKSFSGIKGQLLDLCKPTMKKYEIAISMILGKSSEAIVVENEETAIECIGYLKEKRFGIATFLPLDKLQVSDIQENLRTLGAGVRMAIDVMEYDSSIEAAVRYCCGNALICDNFNLARDICFNRAIMVKAVTLDGTIIHKSRLITGGKSTGAQKWTEREVEQLNVQRETLNQTLLDISKQLRNQDKLDEKIVIDLPTLQQEIDSMSSKRDILLRKIKATNEDLEYKVTELLKLQQEIQKKQTDFTQQQIILDELQHKVDAVSASVFSEFCNRVGVANIREYEEAMTRGKSDVHLRIKAQITKLEYQIQFEETQQTESAVQLQGFERIVQEDQERLQEAQLAVNDFTVKSQQADQAVAGAQERMIQADEKVKRAGQILEDLKAEYLSLGDELDKKTKELAENEADLTRLRSERSGILRKCEMEEISIPFLNSSSMQLDDVDDDGSGDGGRIDYDSIGRELRESSSEETGQSLQSAIDKLNEDLAKLSPNMRVMEKLNETENRLHDAEQEYHEIKQRAKSLQDRLAKIKNKRLEKFQAAYQHMEAKIDEIYKELTRSRTFPTGGTAFLVAENSEEPYLDGIKYNAMPPLKRFREMEQLSGGEKTMAAIALLFSIQSYQPSPFFVLDEIDAALDNANVGRLAKFLKKRSEECQFIVISLKPNLYENAQGLVGIWRDQSVTGSRVLTLELEAFE